MPPPKKVTRKQSPPKPRAPQKRRTRKKKSSKWKYRLIFLLIIALVSSPLYYGKVIRSAVSTGRWFRDLFIYNEYPHYSKFGIRIPRKYQLHGIDVSSYQGKIDWNKVAAIDYNGIQVSFSFIKATEGITLVDPYFQRNWRESKKSGVIRGAYHYFKPNKSGAWQAKFFLQTVKLEPGDLPAVIDIEETANLSKAELISNIRDFLLEVEKTTKKKPIIYTGYRFYLDNLKDEFEGYPLWIAHYYQPKIKLSKNTPWHFWQHADNANIDGIKHKVDMNVFNGEQEDLSALLIQHIK